MPAVALAGSHSRGGGGRKALASALRNLGHVENAEFHRCVRKRVTTPLRPGRAFARMPEQASVSHSKEVDLICWFLVGPNSPRGRLASSSHDDPEFRAIERGTPRWQVGRQKVESPAERRAVTMSCCCSPPK